MELYGVCEIPRVDTGEIGVKLLNESITDYEYNSNRRYYKELFLSDKEVRGFSIFPLQKQPSI